MISQLRAAVKSVVFGRQSLHHSCNVGLRDPQSEVSVWLHGLGDPLDISHRNVIAGINPLTIGIGLKGNLDVRATTRPRLSMKFQERGGEKRLLGEIGLRPVDSIPVGDEQLGLFEVRNCRNYCLPKLQRLRCYLSCACQRLWAPTRGHASGRGPTALESHCLFVFYICPRPVVLVSVAHENAGNIFPMDLIGPIGTRSFSLALHSTGTGVPLIERSRRIALSSVPLEQTSVAYELGKNHKNQRVDWEQVSFTTTTSRAFGLPVPQFSLRVREMQITAVRTIGSHKLFICDMVEDQRYSNASQLFIVHGFYQALRKAERSPCEAVVK
jgi:flavin reductase (DIM6/NTAB) family NADH-FMN oxidoreductase RutF